jgi:hypothetical protein
VWGGDDCVAVCLWLPWFVVGGIVDVHMADGGQARKRGQNEFALDIVVAVVMGLLRVPGRVSYPGAHTFDLRCGKHSPIAR